MVPTSQAYCKPLLPANLDPRFAGRQIPPGYLTLVTGLQSSFLVDPKRLDPDIVAFHESLKETVTIDELVSLQVNEDARQLKVPVLLLVSEFDRVLCGNLVNCSDRRSILALDLVVRRNLERHVLRAAASGVAAGVRPFHC